MPCFSEGRGLRRDVLHTGYTRRGLHIPHAAHLFLFRHDLYVACLYAVWQKVSGNLAGVAKQGFAPVAT